MSPIRHVNSVYQYRGELSTVGRVAFNVVIIHQFSVIHELIFVNTNVY